MSLIANIMVKQVLSACYTNIYEGFFDKYEGFFQVLDIFEQILNHFYLEGRIPKFKVSYVCGNW